jgi:LmbE family N-acetylglucosaminyl deacetylase
VLQSKIVGEGFFPDQQLKLSPTLVQWIENIVSTNNPTVVLTHCPTDLNMDHRVVAEAVMLATRPFSKSGKLVSWVLGFTVDVDQLPALNLVTKVVLPLTEAALALKLKALHCYGNEMRAWPHPRSYEALEHHMRWFGSTIGYPAGEPYMVIRGILR